MGLLHNKPFVDRIMGNVYTITRPTNGCGTPTAWGVLIRPGAETPRPGFTKVKPMVRNVTDLENPSEVQQRNLRTTRHTIVYDDVAEAFENSVSRTLGLDQTGSVHTFDAATSTVTVTDQFGRVEWVEELAANGRTVAAWTAFVAQKRGWL